MSRETCKSSKVLTVTRTATHNTYYATTAEQLARCAAEAYCSGQLLSSHLLESIRLIDAHGEGGGGTMIGPGKSSSGQ